MTAMPGGFGLGLRKDHYREILETRPALDWFEAIAENYMVDGGMPLHYLDAIHAHYPLVLHGVSLSIGSTDPLDLAYLARLKQLAERVDALWVSDHLCWTGIGGLNLHDLLPLPFTEEALTHVVRRVSEVQERLGRRILLENVSSYLRYRCSELTEWEFLAKIAVRADCHLLLDVNNIYVSAFNHGFDARCYLDGLPVDRIKQIHLAGHTHHGTHIVDTHDDAVCAEVWTLYRDAIERFGAVPTMIERDDDIPSLATLCDELAQARDITNDVISPACVA